MERNSAISGVQITCAPWSPVTIMSPTVRLSMPQPRQAPRKSLCVAGSNMKLPLICRTIASVCRSHQLLADQVMQPELLTTEGHYI